MVLALFNLKLKLSKTVQIKLYPSTYTYNNYKIPNNYMHCLQPHIWFNSDDCIFTIFLFLIFLYFGDYLLLFSYFPLKFKNFFFLYCTFFPAWWYILAFICPNQNYNIPFPKEWYKIKIPLWLMHDNIFWHFALD